MRRFLTLSFLILIVNFTFGQQFDVLVFSKTAGFRHSSIPAGQVALQKLGEDNDFSVAFSEDAADFTLENLIQYETVVFLSTTGDILNQVEQEAFEMYITQGGGYVGIHAASDTEYNWEWYGGLVGTYFNSHPAIQAATIEVADKIHPSTSFLPDYWQRTDEWYNYQENPRGKVHVLATLDENTYQGGNMGHDHPIAWCHEYEGGRSWYTGGGHTVESYSEDNFMQHILGGILYTSGQIAGDFTATISEKFEMQVLDNNPVSPMAIAVLPSLDVLYIERAGKVKMQKESTGEIMVVGELNVDSGREDGLIGIAIDPDFANNHWIYLFYSPVGQQKQHVSRFDFIEDHLDLDSEVIVLEIPVQRAECCHSGGDLEFDIEGNLWIAVGDNVNPFQSDGFAPIDERPGRAAFDAQGTSANTMDLRGKILRIHPEDDGSYSIPSGNLFIDADEGLPEIYVMGSRNPFRIAVHDNGDLVWGDVGPDAANNSASRGPRGYDEINLTSEPGNFGWPYAVADNKAYNDFDFSNGNAGAAFNVNNLMNSSLNNTGAVKIPPAKPAWLFYHNGSNPDRPELDGPGGRSILGGAFYRYEADNETTFGLPKYFDDVLFIGDWSRNWINEVRLDDEGNLLQINPFLPHIDLNSPIDMEIGPDGNMYIAEWGTGFTNDNEDARIIKISYMSIAGNRAPIALISSDVQNGLAPLEVKFDGSKSRDPDIGDAISYSWDFNDDGIEDSDVISPTYTYAENGVFNATLKLTDQEGEKTVAQIEIVVGNSRPRIDIAFPEHGGFFEVRDTIIYQVNTEDPEDGNECEQNLPLGISVEPSIGHDDHAHGEGSEEECFGEFITSPHGDGDDDVFYVLNAQYSDRGGEVGYSLSDNTFHVLQPKTKQAQFAQEYFDCRTENTGDFLGGNLNMAYINHNSYLRYSPMNFKNIKFLTVRWAALNHESKIEVHIDAPDGPIIAERSLPITGDWQTYDYYTMDLLDPGGTHDVYLVFKKPGQSGLGNINFMEFHGKGIATSDHQLGMGLVATYFENDDFSGSSVSRNEPMIAWDWDNAAPIAGIPSDGFSVRWKGRIFAPSSGNHKISAQLTSGSYEVKIDGQNVSNANFNFTAGQEYEIVVEYVHTNGDASMLLRWEGPNPVNVIHTRYLRATQVTSSLTELDKPLITAYPSPFVDQIFLENVENRKYYKLVNAIGQVVKQGEYENSINTSQLPPGSYLLKVDGQLIKMIKGE